MELPTEEMIISMEEQREALDQESREQRIQELALQLLHNRAILSEGTPGGRSLSSGSGFDFHQEEQQGRDDRIHLEDGWIGFHEPR